MTSAPLLAVLLAAFAGAQPKTAPVPAPLRTDPASVAPEHRDVFDRYTKWRDADGGMAQGLAAARKKDPAAVDAAFTSLKGVLSRDEYAVLESHYRLAARGVDAPMPAGARRAESVPAAAAPAAAPSPLPSPVGAASAAFKGGPSSLSTSAPPPASPSAGAPTSDEDRSGFRYYFCLVYPTYCR